MRTKRTTRITSMMSGENTHHQEILMTPKSLRMRRMRNVIVIIPTPDEFEFAIVIFFIS